MESDPTLYITTCFFQQTMWSWTYFHLSGYKSTLFLAELSVLRVDTQFLPDVSKAHVWCQEEISVVAEHKGKDCVAPVYGDSEK